MPSIRTNLLRIQINSKFISYEVDINCKIPLDLHHHSEISSFINNSIPNTLYSHPYLYSTTPLLDLTHNLYLSNGAAVQLQLTRQGEGSSAQLLPLIGQRLMTLTDLLYSPQLGSCFNPFEEKRKEEERQIPGFRIEAVVESEPLSLFLVPLVLQFNMKEDISEDSQVLLDYYSGNFCLKQNIVRIDKVRGEVHFRDGSVLQRSGLKAIAIKAIGGYPLAHELYSFFTRVKDSSIAFCQVWGLKFDSRFLQSSILAIHPGQVTFRNGHDRSLSDIITPMSQHNWTYQWIQFFKGGCLEDVLETEVVFLCAEGERGFAGEFGKQLEIVRFRMGLNLSCKTMVHKGLELVDELVYSIRRESANLSAAKIYLFFNSAARSKQEKENSEKLLQFLIEQNVLFHSIEIEQKEYNMEALVYQTLCLFYTKFRLNPWKIKNIPFSNAPMVVMTLHLQPNRQGLISLSLVATMNLFLTKFTAVHKLVQPQTLKKAIEEAVRECVSKFQSVHNRNPTRIFIFRAGYLEKESSCIMEEHRFVKDSIYLQTGSLITYISLSKEHALRSFTQLDSNYVARDSCKRVQALLYTSIKDQVYVQLELEQPMHKVTIYDVEKNDPNFIPKILELTAKVVFGGVGNRFGKGLGFIDYARRLNELREFNLQPWRGMLRDGILTFL